MTELPRPVIMVSSLTQEGAVATLEALEIGAFDCVAKQRSYASLDIVKVRDELVAKIIAAAGSWYESGRFASRASPPTTPTGNFLTSVPSIVAIGTSTGGPRALQQILPMLPADLPVPVLVVQHMPVGFTGPFAKRLNAICNITVEETTENAVLTRGHVYIAAAGSHVSLNRHSNGQVVLHASTHPADALHIPSVDVMMTSVATTYHGLAMGIILTGMGADGVRLECVPSSRRVASHWGRTSKHASFMACHAVAHSRIFSGASCPSTKYQTRLWRLFDTATSVHRLKWRTSSKNTTNRDIKKRKR